MGKAEINVPQHPNMWRKAKLSFKSFKFNELVLHKIPSYRQGERCKMSPRFEGPYGIIF